MQHLIEDLWNGRIAPCEDCGAHDPEICELLDLMDRNRKASKKYRLCGRISDSDDRTCFLRRFLSR